MKHAIPIFMLMMVASIAVAEPSGIVKGVVCLDGNPPPIKSVEPRHDEAVCGTAARPLQVLELGPSQSLRNAIVYLDSSGLNGRASQTVQPVVIDQKTCGFAPRIQLANDGASLILKNSDPVLHVLHITALSSTNRPSALLDVATPYAGYEKQFQLSHFRQPTLLRVANTNGRPWMVAYIAVMPHRWAVLTDANGAFELRDVPVGVHTLHVWHETLGVRSQRVTVTTVQPVTVDIRYGNPD
jgi:hypothetical protein